MIPEDPPTADFLQPYVARLPNLVSVLKSQTLTIGERSIVARPWEIGLLNQMFKDDKTPPPVWGELVARGLALQIKTLQDLDALKARGPIHEIINDPAFQPNLQAAQTLLTGLQAAINGLIAKGDRENYKHLSTFRRVLYDLFFQLKHGTA
jgi:hypothetical protein